jgi:muramidase (phage lysozyme)
MYRPRLALLALPLMLSGGCVVEGIGPDGDDLGTSAAPAHYLDIGHDTFHKREAIDSTSLSWGSGKCRLFEGARIVSATAPRLVGDHFLIDMTTDIPGCEFTRGYVWSGHVSDASDSATGEDPTAPGGGPCHADISRRQCALLSTIAYAEGTRDRYDIIFSFATFSSYADHPRRVMCSSGYCSDAAGRYQFLSTTWDWVAPKLGLRDFTPASQDRAGLWLVSYRGVSNIDAIDTYAEFADAMYALNREWASLPGSPYGQPTHSTSSLWQVYRSFAGL